MKIVLLRWISIALIIFGFWYISQQLAQMVKPAKQFTTPDRYATDITIQHFSDDGRLSAQLKTPQAIHDPMRQTTVFKTPLLYLFSTPHEFWKLTARNGQLNDDHLIAILWDQVDLSHWLNQKQLDWMTTRYVVIHLQDQTADTRAPVKWTKAEQVVTATGMHADFKDKTIHLLQNVRAQLPGN